MPFLWLSVPDAIGRGYVECNSIALASRLAQGLDPPSARWLGRDADRTEICDSGLWNVRHVHRLCELLKRYDLGVRTATRTVEDISIDRAFFSEI